MFSRYNRGERGVHIKKFHNPENLDTATADVENTINEDGFWRRRIKRYKDRNVTRWTIGNMNSKNTLTLNEPFCKKQIFPMTKFG